MEKVIRDGERNKKIKTRKLGKIPLLLLSLMEKTK
jgi:hypothetical protein